MSAMLAIAMLAFGLATMPGCNSGADNGGDGTRSTSGAPQFLSMGTAPIGGTFPIVGDAIAQTLNKNKGDNSWKVQAKGTKGSQANIRGLAQGDLQFALSNSAISYFAVRGESGWEKAYDIRTVVTMAPNVGMFVTKADSGIKSISDLKGKRVVTGPAGAGFEMFVGPILEEHGVALDDIDKVNSPQGPAVDMLGDGAADAAFLGGAVPAAAISQACASYDTYFLPYEPEAKQRLLEKYPFFHPVTVPGGTYQGHEKPFDSLNVGSMHLITYADADGDLIYEITKTIWENREAIAEKHGAGKAINEKNAARYTGTEFHPAAVRFYREAGIWQGEDEGDAAAEDAAEEAAAEEAAAEDESQAPEAGETTDSPKSDQSEPSDSDAEKPADQANADDSPGEEPAAPKDKEADKTDQPEAPAKPDAPAESETADKPAKKDSPEDKPAEKKPSADKPAEADKADASERPEPPPEPEATDKPGSEKAGADAATSDAESAETESSEAEASKTEGDDGEPSKPNEADAQE